jgi:folate-binding protein YgfZ
MINTEINYTTILKNKRLISITGDESKDFLNNLLTNDLSSLDKKDSIYSCLLTPQGKVNSHFFITKKNNEYLIIIDEELVKDFTEKLNFYKLRLNVKIETINNLVVLFSLDKKINLSNTIVSFNDPRHEKFGKYFIIESSQTGNVKNLSDDNEYYKNFINQSGLIDNIFTNLKDKFFSLECNMKELNAIDFKKGCFVGQENTARMNLKDKISKRIILLESKNDLKIDEDILFENEIIGKVVSVNPNFGSIKMKDYSQFKNKDLVSKSGSVKINMPNWINI